MRYIISRSKFQWLIYRWNIPFENSDICYLVYKRILISNDYVIV